MVLISILKYSTSEVSDILLILFCIDLKVETFGFTIRSDSFNNDANLFVLISIY